METKVSYTAKASRTARAHGSSRIANSTEPTVEEGIHLIHSFLDIKSCAIRHMVVELVDSLSKIKSIPSLAP